MDPIILKGTLERLVIKDPTGTIDGSIHHKVLEDVGLGKHILVGSVMILQEGSFEIPRGQPTGGDLEMGTQRPINSGELGLDNFFKKVQQIEKQYKKE